MRLVRTLLFWLHLATGVTVGVVVLIMSVTGVLLTYEKQITRWADARGLDGAPPSPDPKRLDVAAQGDHCAASSASRTPARCSA